MEPAEDSEPGLSLWDGYQVNTLLAVPVRLDTLHLILGSRHGGQYQGSPVEVLDGSEDIPFGMLGRQGDDLDAGVLGILQPRQVEPSCSAE